MYKWSCLMAHDCVPNTFCSIDGEHRMRVTSAVPILKGQMITTSYTFSLDNTHRRRKHLKVRREWFTVLPIRSSRLGNGPRCDPVSEKDADRLTSKMWSLPHLSIQIRTKGCGFVRYNGPSAVQETNEFFEMVFFFLPY